MKIKKIIFVSLFFVLLFSFGLAFAQEIKYPSLPGVEPPQIFLKKIEQGIYPQGEAFFLYLKYFLHFFFFISVPILLVVLIWGGISYLTSADSVVKRKEAKERVLFGFLGILLLFFSYLILGMISPQFAIFRPFELLKKGEYEEISLKELESTLSFVELPIENSIESVLCSKELCQGGFGANDIRSQIKCGYSRGENLDFCDCKQVEVIKYQIIEVTENGEKKYIVEILKDENNEPKKEKMCLIDAVYYIGKAYATQFKYVNKKIKARADKVLERILSCQCTVGCYSFTDQICCCLRSKNKVGCLLNPNEERKKLRKLINMDLEEGEEKNLDYETLRILYEQIADLRCVFYQELFKLEKNDALLSGCAFQYNVMQATSQPELKNYEIEIEEMGGPKIRVRKLYETLDTNKLVEDLEGLTKLDLDDIGSILSIKNRQKFYTIWRDLRSFILYTPDSPTNFYCQKTDEFKAIHQDAEKRSYAKILNISPDDLEKFDEANLMRRARTFLSYIGKLRIGVLCHPIPTSILGTFPPDSKDLEGFFPETAGEISEKIDSFSDFLKKTPPEDIEVKIKDVITEILDVREKIKKNLVPFLQSLLPKL